MRFLPAAQSRAGRGITLIELMLVVVIMIAVMAISSAAFTGMTRGTSGRAAVSQLTSALALTRQYAITHREELYFECATGPGANSSMYKIFDNADNVISEASLPAGQWLDLAAQTYNPAQFRRDGTLANGASHALFFVTNPASPGVRTRINVNGLTGLVKVTIEGE